MADAPDVLGRDPRPSFFPIRNAAELGLFAPDDRIGVAVRTWVRALSGMQKEALVLNGATGRAWRLVSDEGPYLAGHDRAPCPLCTFITGMVSSYMNEITGRAAGVGLQMAEIELQLSNHYSMEGSALQETMIGGALSPELEIRVAADADVADITSMVGDAVRASPVNGLLSDVTESLFTLTSNSGSIPVGRVAALGGDPHPDPRDGFDRVEVASVPVADDLVVKIRPSNPIEGVPGGVNSSLQESQSRTLHVQARCRVRPDGMKEIHESLHRPIGSEFSPEVSVTLIEPS